MAIDVVQNILPRYTIKMIDLNIDLFPLRSALFCSTVHTGIMISFERRLSLAGSEPETPQRGADLGPGSGGKAFHMGFTISLTRIGRKRQKRKLSWRVLYFMRSIAQYILACLRVLNKIARVGSS